MVEVASWVLLWSSSERQFFVCILGRVVNISSMLSVTGLKQCSPELQQRFCSEDVTEDELVALMRKSLDDAKKGEHKQHGWPDMAYSVSKIGVTVHLPSFSSGCQIRRLTNELIN